MMKRKVSVEEQTAKDMTKKNKDVLLRRYASSVFVYKDQSSVIKDIIENAIQTTKDQIDNLESVVPKKGKPSKEEFLEWMLTVQYYSLEEILGKILACENNEHNNSYGEDEILEIHLSLIEMLVLVDAVNTALNLVEKVNLVDEDVEVLKTFADFLYTKQGGGLNESKIELIYFLCKQRCALEKKGKISAIIDNYKKYY